MHLNKIHHIAIICSDYQKSKHFYVEVLGLSILKETFRKERRSYKLDLALNGVYMIELFSFPDPPKRVSRPEAQGLRHLAFEVDNISQSILALKSHGVPTEEVRIDKLTNKKFTFFSDPDELPIELYEK
ncbi:VOC family protein [uncultured Kriegella sp.]|uniref:SMU1112c/YaeR family gloxylase I-like metalloprotein n=1 Tax=uncultured Kriegella sp. TaxID=1798910 RepID=UPI0030DD25E0